MASDNSVDLPPVETGIREVDVILQKLRFALIRAFQRTPRIQSGTGQLSAGVLVVNAQLSSSSRITVNRILIGGTAGTILMTMPAERDIANGKFTIRSVNTTGAAVATDTSHVDWVVVG